MKNLWNPLEANKCQSDLDLRVYSSRLLGQDPTLVLHGGGNTSVKIRERNLVGDEEEILYVKGSGWDLETIQAEGFAPVRMAHLLKLAQVEALSDPQMVNELATQVTHAGAPAPSVETILHAVLPHKFVDHTHADAVLAVTGPDVLDFFKQFREHTGILGELMRSVSRFFGTEATFADSDIEDARHGAGFLAIHSLSDSEAAQIVELIRPLEPLTMQWYLAGGIRSLI